MALHTDFRPKTLGEVFGNQDIVKVLKKLLSKKDKPHSYLFTGPRGCGKTTFAKIIANELGCNLQYDFIELNAASFRGIDTARDVISKINLPPMAGKVRVWFFDECHQLTKDAQEAMLKAIEQPPEHAYFIFSTTDPQDLKPTLKDRCMQFQVKPLNSRDCIKFIKSILTKINQKLDLDLIKEICDIAQGRPRSILVLLEKVLATDDEEEQYKILSQNQDELEVQVKDLIQALIKHKSWKQVASILKKLQNEDPEKIRRAVLGYLNAILLNKQDDYIFKIMLNFSEPFYNNGRAALTMACYASLFE